MARVRFSAKEDEILMNEIKNNPTNIQFAFEEAAKKLPGRNAPGIAKRWYSHLRKREDAPILTCGSKKGFSSNRKNTHRNADGTLPDQELKHYLYVLKELLELPSRQRKAILELLSLDK